MVLRVLISVNILIGMIAFGGQLLIGIAIPKLSEDLGKSTVSSILKDFNRYQESLKFYLAFSAGMISFSVITTSFLRKSLLAAVDAGAFDIFPVEFIFAYGMSFTVILAIFYLPIYYQLRLKGVELNSKYSALFTGDEEKLPDNEDFLIKENGISNLKVALSILAPVLTSILGDIVNI